MQNSSDQGFPSTDWKLVECAGAEPTAARQEALGALAVQRQSLQLSGHVAELPEE